MFNLHEMLALHTPPHYIFSLCTLEVLPEELQPHCRLCEYKLIYESMPAIFVCFPVTCFVNFKGRAATSVAVVLFNLK